MSEIIKKSYKGKMPYRLTGMRFLEPRMLNDQMECPLVGKLELDEISFLFRISIFKVADIPMLREIQQVKHVDYNWNRELESTEERTAIRDVIASFLTHHIKNNPKKYDWEHDSSKQNSSAKD